MKRNVLISLSIVIALGACKKTSEEDKCPTTMKLSVTNAAPVVGEPFKITAPREITNNFFQWAGPNQYGSNNSNSIDVSEAKYSDRGWYYCSKSNTECNIVTNDSIFIDVQLKQETPPCSLTENFISCSNIPDVALTSITKDMDPTFNGMAVYGSGSFGYPSFRILFNSYNGNTEPIDGTYNTTNKLSFDVTQEYNDVSVSFLFSSIFFHCHPNQKLYVKHVNGKIQVSFCDMVFSSGSATLTTCSGKMTEQ